MKATAVLALTASLLAMATVGQGAQKTRAFTSADRAFRVTYPADFEVCTAGSVDSCNHSFIPVCSRDALVCLAYPAGGFKGTNFEAAAFQVSEVSRQEEMTADVCMTPYPQKDGDTVSSWPEFLISAEHPEELIDGVGFVHGVSGGAATGHSIGIDLYRGFHNGRCFELSVSEAGTNPNNFDPPLKTLTPAQRKKLDETMSDILHSFRFGE